jgi:N-acetylglucosamine repressor
MVGTQHLRVDSQVARQLNLTAVLNLVRTRSITSRIELVRETGLSKATISEIVDHLSMQGFVRTVGRGEASGGRPPILLEFDPQARFAIGIQLGDSVLQVMLTDLNAMPIRTLSVPAPSNSADDAITAVIPLIEELKSKVPAEKLLGVGVGTPGLVDSEKGIIQMAPDLGWRNVPIAERLREACKLPTYVVNRAKASALAESWCGSGRSVDNMVYVSISTGIAAGIVVNGQLYRGVSMSEGEIGHITVLPDGPLCPCGNRGCLQTVAAGPALLARAREKLRFHNSSILSRLTNGQPDLLTVEHLAEAASQNDPLVTELFEEVAQYIGIGLANLINLLNPRMLILGGRVIRTLPQFVPYIETAMRRRAMPTPSEAVTVVPSLLGNNVVSMGAAAFLLSQVSLLGE